MINFKSIDILIEMQHSVLEWGEKNTRKFPWRETDDRYRITMAEIFLQRTAVRQVLPVYTEFMQKYPDIQSFFSSDKTEVLKIIAPLGLKWRAEKLLEMRDYIYKNLNGNIPSDREELLKIPCIGSYTASVVRICGFGCLDIPLDTNTVRITGRVFGLEIKDSSRRDERFRQGLSMMIYNDEPKKSFYSLLDIGNAVCTKNRPTCKECPLKIWCAFLM